VDGTVSALSSAHMTSSHDEAPPRTTLSRCGVFRAGAGLVLAMHLAAGCPKLRQQIVCIGLRRAGNVKLGLG